METNAQLLQQKLDNYKAFLRQNVVDSADKPEALERLDALDKYGVQEFIVFGASTLNPLHKTGQMDVAVKKTVEHFHLDAKPEVLAKLGRYYQFLVDFLSQPVVE